MINPPLRLLAAVQTCFGGMPPLLCPTAGRDMWAAARLDGGHQYHVIAHDLDNRTVFDRRSALQKRSIRNRPLPRWARYTAGALLVLSDEGLSLPGGTIMLMGDEPAGPRYEHALGMAFAAAYLEVNQQLYDVARLLDIMEQAQKHYLSDLATF